MNPFFTDYSEYIARFFPGRKVQKISVNAGFSCPNRDGRIGTGGCIYCNNASFTPSYCFSGASVREQLETGKRFFARKYKDMQYIAYLQSYTNTYISGARSLNAVLEEAVGVPDVVAVALGTRPDCFDRDIADLLAAFNRRMPVFVEFGVETMRDPTLSLIHRGHTSADSVRAIRLAASRGLHVGVHLIAGLPGEPPDEILRSLGRVCSLPIESVKIHHLQVLAGTRLQTLLERGELETHHYTVEDYLDLCVRMVGVVPPHIAIERFLASAPSAMVLSPKWGLKNYEFTNLLLNRLSSEATAHVKEEK